MTRALITGITGQDGAYLAHFLLKKGYTVFGTFRRQSSSNFWRLYYLKIANKIKLIPADVLDSTSIYHAFEESNPTEIYHLAAQSFVGASFDQPLYTSDVTGFGTVRVLDEILKFNKKIKFYQASSSEMFGSEKSSIKNESTPFMPSSPYAISKLYAYWQTKLYREAYDLYAVNGILFNHESPLRGLEFVTRKISNEVAKISLGISTKLELGNISAKRDWGYAPEYVEGIWKSLQVKNPDDYVMATNESHSVKEFAEKACEIANISKKHISTSKKNLRPFDVNNLQGDYSKAKRKLGWKPKTKFNDLVKIMVQEDIHRWEQRLKGEYLPWDAGTA
ncbi:GDP-mannose 4,6-dehydratase [Nitrosopumilus zosterae]|uniref:GDP-mannose 4,6-dehydratase n=1 Tax=Nitrosopumilus zosterae TaxID=718286 RepID=A0A2S2KUA7_9ARCH|nr:GDP-mannose 4,6-dehydratase [Nitrosopumilus zosterae]BDQ31821.1 GDP-mannose 4,6-dehydratase [Nitrosopumilus zosterae]GBH35171.1 GDP-mannose 4,6-dehydratase [Nitrosopumilus zosterae]